MDELARRTMQPISREEILDAAIRVYGVDAQMKMMIEEMSELTKALCKFWRKNADGRAVADILEEMADVQIMLDQMKIIFGETKDIEAAKIARLKLSICG